MEKQRIDKLYEILEECRDSVDEKVAAKLEIDKTKRIIERLSSFSTDCEECYQQFLDMENHLLQMQDRFEDFSENGIKDHQEKIADISSHLQKQHKLVTSGYYLSIYMSAGMGIGLLFGLLIFDNIALGLPIGVGIGVAIGAGLDEDAKKKGMTF